MKRILTVVFALILVVPVYAQAQEIELPEYTADQRWERASRLWVVTAVGSIAYAKSMGQTVEEYSEASAALFVPGWGEPGGGTLSVIVGMHRNYLAFAGAEFELVEQTDQSVTARSNRTWAGLFGDDEVFYGVTLEEYEKSFQIFNSKVAEHLGLVYQGWTDGDWFYMKFDLQG